MRIVAGLAPVLALAACGVHSTLECTDRIPCPSGMECSPEGVCVLVLPEDGPVDARAGLDAPDARIPDAPDLPDAPDVPDAPGGCGDRLCLGDETCVSCPADCGECPFTCGNGACEPSLGEDCMLCPFDCGACPECDHGPCEPGGPLDPGCEPCAGMVCAFDPFCCMGVWDDLCVAEARALCPGRCAGACGDGICAPDGSESCIGCPSDCGPCPPLCGDLLCDPLVGETCATCPGDCGMCGGCVDQELGGPLPITTSGSTVGRGNDQTGASCGDGGAVAPDLVFRFTAPASGSYRFTTLGSTFDTILYARAGDCAGAILACNDDAPGGGLHSVFQEFLAAGQTIVIVLDGWGGGQGSYTLRIEAVGMGGCGDGACAPGETCSSCPSDCGPCPGCVDFVLPPTVPVSASGSTVGAGNQQMGGCGDTSAPEHVYEYTAPVTGTYRFDTVGSFYDTLLYVRAGDCSGPQLGCNDDVVPGVDTTSRLVLSLGAGTRVVVVVDGWASSAGSYQLNVALQGMAGCGDGACAPGESCTTCPLDCGACPCPHDECTEGGPLGPGCSPCVSQVCAADPYCCATAWDGRCIAEAQALCGIACGGFCGDGFCDPMAGERCERCPVDCGPCGGFCGDFFCDLMAGERCDSCPLDCGPCDFCGDGVCSAFEVCFDCELDCGGCLSRCGDGVCDPRQLEFCFTCPGDCPCM